MLIVTARPLGPSAGFRASAIRVTPCTTLRARRILPATSNSLAAMAKAPATIQQLPPLSQPVGPGQSLVLRENNTGTITCANGRVSRASGVVGAYLPGLRYRGGRLTTGRLGLVIRTWPVPVVGRNQETEKTRFISNRNCSRTRSHEVVLPSMHQAMRA